MAAFAFFQAYSEDGGNMPRVALPQEAPPQFAVVVAARDLPAGHLLARDDVVVQDFVQIPAGSFSAAPLVQGRVLAEAVEQGSVIAEPRLVAGLAGLLAEGERAVSINVNEAMAVGHKLKPGDWVDVFVVLGRDGQDVETAQSRLLLPQKKILAYGEKLLLASPTAADDANEKESAKQVARTAVLAIPVEEINRLLLAEKQGELQLALRSPIDVHQPSADVLQQIPGMGIPATLPEGVHKVTAALDGSLLPLKTADLVKDVHSTAKKTAPSTAQAERAKSRKTEASGASVEIIRGTQREMLRY